MQYIYAIHEPPSTNVLDMYRNRGWIVFTHAIGHNPDDYSSMDYTPWQDFGIIARLNNDYGATIPTKENYDSFAVRCANFVAASKGCHLWQLSNEPNFAGERPEGIPILPRDYAQCYVKCQAAIRSLQGHQDDEIIVAPVAPWNAETAYPGNERGDWVKYLVDVLAEIDLLGAKACALAIHSYTHGTDPSLITDESRMDYPFEDRRYNFRVYQDFLNAIPSHYKDVPIYITETDQNDPWLDQNTGWVQKAYQEIDDWNKTTGTQKIHCLALYRWPKYDKWHIDGKWQVVADFEQALTHNYKWSDNKMDIIYEDGFENGFYDYQGISEVTVPNDWIPDWQGVRPEYDKKDKEAGQPEVRSGRYAANLFTVHAEHEAVLYRQFNVVPQSDIRASVWCMNILPKAGHGMTIGINPIGGTDFQSPDVVWGNWWSHYMNEWQDRTWSQVAVEAIAGNSGIITVFLKSKADYAMNIMAAHFDDFVLEGEEGTLPPQPGGGLTPEDLQNIRRIVREELDKTRLGT